MIDAKELLTDCRRVVDTLVDDLRARTDDHEESRESARLVYSQAQMAGRTDKTWEEWREDLLAQVASGWVLAAVFVRFCEDNRLVEDPLLSGPGDRGPIARDHRAEFFAANPQAGDREWLQEVFDRYRKLPAVSEVFGERNPLWQLAPSADGARELLELWWATDEDGTRLRHDFTDPDWGTRFLGDLYQDLSEHARKQYALLQTPEFVEEFILDRTLDPAIAEFGLDDFKMIDPTCGSGHFLLGAFNRLVEAWREAEPNTSPRELAQRALDSVHGVDINPFAVAIARFRLLVSALGVSGETRLENLPNFHLKLAVGDSLLHGTSVQLSIMEDATDPLATHRYPSEDGEAANRLLQPGTYHAVVGNPPYITVKDKALNQAYRERYRTCHRKYSLGVPFTERFWGLAVVGTPQRSGGFIGTITANSFTKRELGKKLIEEFLPGVYLTHVVDTSGAYIPGHGTPTLILAGRNQAPKEDGVRMVLGIQGEPSAPDVPADGVVWTSLRDHVGDPGFEDDYISVVDRPRAELGHHPWTLRGGAAPDVQAAVERAPRRLSDYVEDMGFGAISGADDQFTVPAHVALRHGVEPELVRPVVDGTSVRDWRVDWTDVAVFPYQGGTLVDMSQYPNTLRFLWPRKPILAARSTFGGRSYQEEGRAWWEWHQVTHARAEAETSFHVAEVATHNHFAKFIGQHVGKQTAPIALPKSTDEATLDGLLAVLNSSAACFWLKEVCYPKGGDQVGDAGARVRKTLWDEHYALNTTNVLRVPLPTRFPVELGRLIAEAVERLKEAVEEFAREPLPVLSPQFRRRVTELRGQLVALQEEVDWWCYAEYGVIDERLTADPGSLPPVVLGSRAFEIRLASDAPDRERDVWFLRHGSAPPEEWPEEWPDSYSAVVRRRLELIGQDRVIRLLERPEHKRRWNWESLDELEARLVRVWLLERVESHMREADVSVTSVARLVDLLLGEADAAAILEAEASHARTPQGVMEGLLAGVSVPFLSQHRHSEQGLRKLAAWRRAWEEQREIDTVDGEGYAKSVPNKRDAATAPPPVYRVKDFRRGEYWSCRGPMDVPSERFITYPGTSLGADTTAVIGWAGWDHLQQARALAAHYNTRRSDGAEDDELVPLLAGLSELLPWLTQWHNDPDPTFGERMGDFFAGFVDSEAAAIGVTTKDLADWRPPAKTTRRRKKKASS